MCSPHVCARCRVGTGSRTPVGRQAKGPQANLEKRELWSRRVGVPLCRRCPAVPAFSRAHHSTPPSGARRALDATEWRRDWRMPSCRRISCHSTPPSGTRVVHSTPPSGAVRLRPAETASSPLSYRAGSPDYCVSSGLVHGTVAVAPTVRRDDRVHLVAEAAPGVATSRQQIDDLT